MRPLFPGSIFFLDPSDVRNCHRRRGAGGGLAGPPGAEVGAEDLQNRLALNETQRHARGLTPRNRDGSETTRNQAERLRETENQGVGSSILPCATMVPLQDQLVGLGVDSRVGPAV